MKKILIALVACAGMALSACSLDEYNPTSIDESKLSDYPAFYGAQAFCYAPFTQELYGAYDSFYVAECGTDIWWQAKSAKWGEQLISYDGLVPGDNNRMWSKAFMQAYSALGLCNQVLETAPSVSGHDEEVATLVAETHFLRAFYHLQLTTYYGPITLCLSAPTQSPELSPKRNTLSEIYASIISDLQIAYDGLGNQPFEGNRARVTKVSALGMLARAYAQGAGEGLKDESGKSYWELARQTADQVISLYGADHWYSDVYALWADRDGNNRNNKEALFVSAGPDGSMLDNTGWSASFQNRAPNVMIHYFPNITNYIADCASQGSGNWRWYLWGQVNTNSLAPSKYWLDCFDPAWDTRWENTFVTAFGLYCMPYWGLTYEDSAFTMNENFCRLAKLDDSYLNRKIYPYYVVGELDATFSIPNYNNVNHTPAQIITGYDEATGTVSAAAPRGKAYVIDPAEITPDAQKFYLYFSKENLTDAQKKEYYYPVVNIEELMTPEKDRYLTQTEAMGDYPENTPDSLKIPRCYAAWKGMYPGVIKYNWSYTGVYTGSAQRKSGDIYIMRMAEMYLLSAEASVMLGDGPTAAQKLNVLRNRAKRPSYTGSVDLSTATMETVYDEYARELGGEYIRWALLRRHANEGAFETRLSAYNKTAYGFFKEYHRWRPIPLSFLSQIENADEYGDNGYGITANSGLDGFLE